MWNVLRPRRGRRERGAVAVEAALVTPLLLLIVFGTIEFGFIFKDWLGVTSAVRAGARIASAEPRTATFAQDAADQVAREGSAISAGTITELWVYRAGSDGTPDGSGSFDDCSTCVKFSVNEDTGAFTQTSNTWAATSQNACIGDEDRDRVGVYLKVDHPSITGVIGDVALTSHTVMKLEPIPALSGCGP